MMRPNWNVFVYDCNSKSIKIVNVFNHSGFYKDAIKCLEECLKQDEFKTELRREIMYYFGYKVEYEIFITEPFPYVTRKEIDRLVEENVKLCAHVNLECGEKIDVYRQIMMNYEHFIDYLWRNREQFLEKKERNETDK